MVLNCTKLFPISSHRDTLFLRNVTFFSFCIIVTHVFGSINNFRIFHLLKGFSHKKLYSPLKVMQKSPLQYSEIPFQY